MPIAGLLGKLPAVQDSRTLRLRPYLRIAQAPRQKDWLLKVAQWLMLGNDVAGDCTIAAELHAIMLAASQQGQQITFTTQDAFAKYSELSGYNPQTGANDTGLVVLDVLKNWQSEGLNGQHKALAYAACDVRNVEDVAACISEFGFTYIGFAVPRYAMDQFNRGQPWDLDPHGDQTLIGGHAIIGGAYDLQPANNAKPYIKTVTWGAEQVMTLDFFHKYVDEAYGVVVPEWLNAAGNDPDGVNVAALLRDVQQLQSQPTPVNPQPKPSPYLPLYQWLRGEGAYAGGGALPYCEADPAHDPWYASTVVPTQDAWVAYYGSKTNPLHGWWQHALDIARARPHKAPPLPPIPQH